jgi:hypothetical protein
MSAPAEPSNAGPGRTRALQYRFAACIRDPERNAAPEGVEPRRMRVYGELFYNNVESLLSSNFPVIRSLYDDSGWHALARAFLREHQAHTPLFPEFAREFLRFLEQRQLEHRDDPPYLLELAHYEWVELALSLHESELADVAYDPAGDILDGVPVVSPLAWTLVYRYPVHRISPQFRPLEAPAEPTVLLLVRDHADKVGFHEINPLTAALLERLQENEGKTGLVVLEALLEDIAPGNADALRDAGIAILHEMKEREAILGSAA